MEGSQANSGGNKKGKGKATTERTFFTNNLTRIMERALPPYPRAKIDLEAVDAMDRCVAEFAAMITIAATEQQKKESRETMSVDDLIVAMEVLGYDHYVGPLTEYLRRYRESKGTVGHGGRQRAMATVAPRTGEMAPAPQLRKFAPGMPPYGFMVRSQVPEIAVGTREMPPTPTRPSDFSTMGLPLCNFMVRDPAPAAVVAAATGEMAPQPPDLAFVQPPYVYDFMAQGQAQTAVVAMRTREMPPTPPRPSDFTLGLPTYDAMVRGQTPSATRELGMNTNILALWSKSAATASASRMPPAGDDESV